MEIKNIVFRVCRSPTSCNDLQDQYVPEGGNWFQPDLIGVPDHAETGRLGVG